MHVHASSRKLSPLGMLRTMRMCKLINLAVTQLIDFEMRTLIFFGNHFVLVRSYLAGSQFVIVS